MSQSISPSLSSTLREAAWSVRRGMSTDLSNRRGRPSQGPQVIVRWQEVQADLLDENVAYSTYETPAAYLRGVSTGWDRRAPILAKAGVLLHWIRALAGTPVGKEEWQRLEELFQSLIGRGARGLGSHAGPEGRLSLREALRLIEKHVLTAALISKGASAEVEEPGPAPLGLVGRRGHGREMRARAWAQAAGNEGGKKRALGFPVQAERKALIEQAAERSGYESTSAYVRAVALGWDRHYSALARGAVALLWARACAGEAVGRPEWLRLDGLLREHFEEYLFGREFLSGEVDLCEEESPRQEALLREDISSESTKPARSAEPALKEAQEALLGIGQEAVARETGLRLS